MKYFQNIVNVLMIWLATVVSGPKQILYYSLDPNMPANRQAIVETAMKDFTEDIRCLHFTRISPTEDELAKILTNYKVLHIGSIEHHPDEVIGTYHRKTNTILLAERFSNNELLSDGMYLKLTYHELAHALGMVGKPHPFTDSLHSNFAEKINRKTPARMFNADIIFLNKIICNFDY